MSKQSVDDLAIFGGAPAFTETLHVGRPNLGSRDRLLDRINALLDRNWLTNSGPLVDEFEANVARRLGVKHCIAMCNGTVALEIAIRALELKGEVIIPSFTFVATAHSLQWQEITPVFCDIDPATYNIDPGCIEQLITPRTTGIIGVHLWGRPCDIKGLQDIADKHQLKLVFDAAHAFGTSYNARMIGGFGDAEILSFHATKFINTFEGGAVVTNSDELAEKVRLMKNFGFKGMDQVVYLGTNGKMSEVSAAMGLTSLECMDHFIDVNQKNHMLYRKQLTGIQGCSYIRYDETEKNNFQYSVLEVDEQVTGISRDDLIKVLHAENIRARRYFFPGCHRMEPYKSYYPNAHLLLENTDDIAAKVLCLPTGVSISQQDILRICSTIQMIVENGGEIAGRLANKD